MADVPLIVVSDNVSSERRITPSWSIGQLKSKLEPITGVPPSSQRLSLKAPGRESIPIEAYDEESTYLTNYALSPYAELHVSLGLTHSIYWKYWMLARAIGISLVVTRSTQVRSCANYRQRAGPLASSESIPVAGL